MKKMKVFTCTDHDSFFPVGCSSIVVAKSEKEARILLDKRLTERGLSPYDRHTYTLKEIDLDVPSAIILQDGDY